jgi:hypothetical protein
MRVLVATAFILGTPVAVRMATLWLLAAIVALLVVGVVRWRRGSERSRSERPVLPAHYSSLFHADPTKNPGFCGNCQTQNAAGYDFCRECGERLSVTRSEYETDIAEMFDP